MGSPIYRVDVFHVSPVCDTHLPALLFPLSLSLFLFLWDGVARDIKWRRGNVAAPEAARRLKGNEKRDGVDGRMGVGRGRGRGGGQRGCKGRDRETIDHGWEAV